MEEYTIRSAFADEDPAVLLEIYSHYIAEASISPEYVPLTEDELTLRIKEAAQKIPYLVLEDEDGVWGFSFFDYSVNRPLAFVRPEIKGEGWGRELVIALNYEINRSKKRARRHFKLDCYEEKNVRVQDKYGNIFYGEAQSQSAEYCMHEYGVEEAALRVGFFLIYKSDIYSVEEYLT